VSFFCSADKSILHILTDVNVFKLSCSVLDLHMYISAIRTGRHTIYFYHLCPPVFEYINIGEDVQYLKEFVRLRDKEAAFDECRENNLPIRKLRSTFWHPNLYYKNILSLII